MQTSLYYMYDPANDCSFMQKQVFLTKVFKIDSTTTNLFMFLFWQPLVRFLITSIFIGWVFAAITRYVRCGNMLHACHISKTKHLVTHTIKHIYATYSPSLILYCKHSFWHRLTSPLECMWIKCERKLNGYLSEQLAIMFYSHVLVK